MNLRQLLERVRGVRALVVGDLMLDEYIFGRATRISPEAPVMVVRHERTTRVPGGAANVARNIVALGGYAVTVGVAGCDEAGKLLEESLGENGFGKALLVEDPTRSTTRKTRILADHTHQVLRIDHEEDQAISEAVEHEVISAILKAVEDCQVVVLSDYLKGVLTEKVAKETIRVARAKGVPVVVNPKPRSLGLYAGASLISLNRAEASESLGLYRGLQDADAEEAARSLRAESRSDVLLVTLGETGMTAVGESSSFFVQAPKVEVYDTAGAGDTVIASVALGYAAVGFQQEVFELAAQTAGRVVRHVGVATPSAADLEEIGKL